MWSARAPLRGHLPTQSGLEPDAKGGKARRRQIVSLRTRNWAYPHPRIEPSRIDRRASADGIYRDSVRSAPRWPRRRLPCSPGYRRATRRRRGWSGSRSSIDRSRTKPHRGGYGQAAVLGVGDSVSAVRLACIALRCSARAPRAARRRWGSRSSCDCRARACGNAGRIPDRNPDARAARYWS